MSVQIKSFFPRYSSPSLATAAIVMVASLALAGCGDPSDDPDGQRPGAPTSKDPSNPKGSESSERMIHLDQSVVPTIFFSDGEGNLVDDTTPDATAVYRALPGEPDIALLTDTDGEPLTWGEARKARGQAELHCEDEGSRLIIDAHGLRPHGVYTGWLAFFGEPGFEAAGLSSLMAVSPVGPTDGSQSVFVASASGHGELEAVTPAAKASITYSAEVSIPKCLLDTFEVHVILAYHPDGRTCGDNPCEDEAFVEHLAWVVREGEGPEAADEPKMSSDATPDD